MSSTDTSLASFLEGKLRNFRAFLLDKAKPGSQLEGIQKFETVEEVMPYLNHLVIMSKTGALENAVAGMCKELDITADADKQRLRAYLDCFIACLTTQQGQS